MRRNPFSKANGYLKKEMNTIYGAPVELGKIWNATVAEATTTSCFVRSPPGTEPSSFLSRSPYVLSGTATLNPPYVR